ncbi:MAG: PEP/pyruvate-binding domain-containing protein [Anaerolineae bacterium]
MQVRTFGELMTEQLSLAGGKGGTLARLWQAGYPVPDGFVILPDAFVGDRLAPGVWAEVQSQLRRLRQNGTAFAVRSSALSEDSVVASFAGEFETVLDVHTDEMIREAILTVRRSRHSERVEAYSKAQGFSAAHEVAVVVQRLVRAEISGVLFTADAVSGSRTQMIGNFVYGLGDELVSGEAEPYTFRIERPKGTYEGPPVLGRFARRLYKLGCRLERDLGCPQDIEWCVANGKLYLLQSRPITTLREYDPTTGECNATLSGDYLWTNMLSGEVFPVAVTPSTWSVWQGLFENLSFGDTSTIGNIAGRPYLNYSLMYSFMLKFLRSHERIVAFAGDSVGIAPTGMDIPPFPIRMSTILFRLIPSEIGKSLKKSRLKKDVTGYLASVQARCQTWHHQITEMSEAGKLISLWREQLDPLFREVHLLLDAFNEDLQSQSRGLKTELTALVGEDAANTLQTTISGDSGELASLGPLVGLSRLKRGEIDRQEYLKRYGHRTPNENELAEPRPSEDPGWLDRQLEALTRSPVEVSELLERRNREFEAAWEDVQRQIGTKRAQEIRRRIDDLLQTNAVREQTRSELTRVVGVIRALLLRAGELTDTADDIFFLTMDEIAALLSGDRSATAYIPARRKTHKRYRALPPLPAWIRGRFDPAQWAADPERRMDLFDASGPVALTPDSDGLITGHPGSAGRVEGTVRRIDSPRQGAQFQSGEILVTSTTNIGWTPLFPRAAAVITDIGASLSHAAIVARELGIPAVVGCGDATTRLKTGDRVRIDGGRGIVEILETASTLQVAVATPDPPQFEPELQH